MPRIREVNSPNDEQEMETGCVREEEVTSTLSSLTQNSGGERRNARDQGMTAGGGGVMPMVREKKSAK